jgi:hypothetical protein
MQLRLCGAKFAYFIFIVFVFAFCSLLPIAGGGFLDWSPELLPVASGKKAWPAGNKENIDMFISTQAT